MAIRCPEDDRPLGVNGIQQRLVGPILAEQAQVERMTFQPALIVLPRADGDFRNDGLNAVQTYKIAAQQGVATHGWMYVGVVETRQRHISGQIDGARPGADHGLDFRVVAHGHDHTVTNCDRLRPAVIRINRVNATVKHNQVGRDDGGGLRPCLIVLFGTCC